MIRICRFGKTSITIRGHACSAPYGQDLVCCAVSALTLTLAVNLEQIGTPVICLQPGYTEISSVRTSEAVQVFDCIWKGFEVFAQMFPENVLVVRADIEPACPCRGCSDTDITPNF